METTNAESVTRPGLAQGIALSWGALKPEGLIERGDDLIVPLTFGWDTVLARVEVRDHAAYLAEGDLFTRIMALQKKDDIDFLIDRYDVRVRREMDALPASIHVVEYLGQRLSARTFALVQFLQAALDYEAGLEVRQLAVSSHELTIKLQADEIGRMAAVINALSRTQAVA